MSPAHRVEEYSVRARRTRRQARERLCLVLPRLRAQGPATAHGRGQYSVRRDSMPIAVAAALEAMDAWHSEDFAATFAEDAVLEDSSGREMYGRAAVRDWCTREYVRRRLKLRIIADRTRAATTWVDARITPGAPGEPFLAEPEPQADEPGAEHRVVLTFTVASGLITSLRVTAPRATDDPR